MIASIGKIQSLTYTLRNTERFDGELISGMFSVKYTNDPKRCHFHMIRPDNGSELYYSEGRNDNLAVYDPKGFPYVPINLDPMSRALRNQNHHTIFEAGFAFFGQMIGQVYAKDQSSFYNLGKTNW